MALAAVFYKQASVGIEGLPENLPCNDEIAESSIACDSQFVAYFLVVDRAVGSQTVLGASRRQKDVFGT